MSTLQFRTAGPGDADRVAELHADSWRRHYRGAYADSFLDGDALLENRRAVWAGRMTVPGNAETVVAERDHNLVGFVHVVFDEDAKWGSLVDNLHVVNDERRSGIGTLLLSQAAGAVERGATGNAVYLWVLQQNLAAQRFYFARGATYVETAAVIGDPSLLNGSPKKLRMVWSDLTALRSPLSI